MPLKSPLTFNDDCSASAKLADKIDRKISASRSLLRLNLLI
jgi:hypothetical protein